MKDEEDWQKRAKAFSSKVKDFLEILVEQDFDEKPMSLSSQNITYQDSCHLRNVMKTTSVPRKLLKAINGSQFQEKEESHQCCGSAGIYNITEQKM